MNNSSPLITGTQINYYFVCRRKLWLFSHNISMEHSSEYVEMGSLLHDHSYSRKKKELLIDGIKIDFFDSKNGVIHEVKKSRAIEKSHIYQLKYYIYYLKKIGINAVGEINYPLLKRKEKVDFDTDDEEYMVNIMHDINGLIEQSAPPDIINKPFCKKCSYYELCYV